MTIVEDESQETQALHRAMRRGALVALLRLTRAARGQETFESDHELRACITLARLSACLVNQSNPIDPPRCIAHPDLSPQEVERLLCELENGSEKEAA